MKHKIVFIMHEMSMGGAQRVVATLVNNMNKEKYDIHLILFNKSGLLLNSLNNDINIHDLQSKRVFSGSIKLLKLLFYLKPDIVFSSIGHVNLLLGMSLPLLRRKLANTSFIIREVNNPTIRAKYIKQSQKQDFFYRLVINKFDYVIAQSNFMKNDLINYYGVNKKLVYVVENPVDVKKIQHLITKVNDFTFPFSNEKINLVAVGALRSQKGFDKLIKAVHLLDSQYHLYIIGDGKEREQLENLTHTLQLNDKVTFLGFHTNPYVYMNHADLVILSSNYEGFPNVILEANVCGKYVIAFKCPGVNQEIINEGINGTLIECGNVEKLAQGIMKSSTLKDKSKIIQTTSKYSVSKVVQIYESIFDDCLKEYK